LLKDKNLTHGEKTHVRGEAIHLFGGTECEQVEPQSRVWRPSEVTVNQSRLKLR